MEVKEGTDGSKVAGMLDFGPAEQADKDAATQGNEEQQNTQETTEGQPETEQVVEGNEEQKENTDGKEGDTNSDTVIGAPIEVEGRKYKDVNELVTAHVQSSNEGRRLARLAEEKDAMLQELQAKVLELEGKELEQKFPGEMSEDQLELLPQHKQTEYIIAKNRWADQQATLKTQREQGLKKHEEYQKNLKETIDNNDREMASHQDEFPGYKDLKPTMDKIRELTPCLSNRPETPYLTFWIAYGLNAFNKAKATAGKTQQVNDAAKNASLSTVRQAGGEGKGKAPGKADAGESSIVKAWRDRNGAGI